jgi:hypothetical protein
MDAQRLVALNHGSYHADSRTRMDGRHGVARAAAHATAGRVDIIAHNLQLTDVDTDRIAEKKEDNDGNRRRKSRYCSRNSACRKKTSTTFYRYRCWRGTDRECELQYANVREQPLIRSEQSRQWRHHRLSIRSTATRPSQRSFKIAAVPQ